MRHRRVTASGALLGVLALTCVVAAMGIQGPTRMVVSLVAAALVPGGALMTRFNVDEPLAWAGLAVCLSFAIETAGAVVMAWTGWWEPTAWLGALAVASAAALGWDLIRAVHGRLPLKATV